MLRWLTIQVFSVKKRLKNHGMHFTLYVLVILTL